MKNKINLIVLTMLALLLTFNKLSTVDAALSSPPCLESEVMVDTGNGFGSTNTQVRRFTNIDINIGSDITYADNVNDGASFTIVAV